MLSYPGESGSKVAVETAEDGWAFTLLDDHDGERDAEPEILAYRWVHPIPTWEDANESCSDMIHEYFHGDRTR